METLENNRIRFSIGIFLIAVATISLWGSWTTSTELSRANVKLKDYVECEAEWTKFLHQSITVGRDANSASAKALDELIDSIYTATSPQESRAALEKYRQARETQIKSQEENPLPPAPEQVCQLKE